MDRDLEFDPRIFQKTIQLFIPGHIEGLVLVALLVVVSVFPQDAHPHEVLSEFEGAAQVRAGQETKTAAVDLQRLVGGEFHREVSHFFSITFINRVRD